MAKKAELETAAVSFRDALAKLSNDAAFSDAERDSFSRLLDFYQDRLESFKTAPRYGDASDYYDTPLEYATRGAAAAAGCKPGDAASQQPTYDNANAGGDALESVTAAQSALALSALRGSLLSMNTSPGLPPQRAPLSVGHNYAMARSALGLPAPPPAAPPPPGAPPPAAPPAPPAGPVPPAKTGTADPPWFAKLMTMFPAEAVTAYVAGQQYFDGGHIWLVLVTLVAVLIVRWFALMSPDGKPNYLAVGIAAGSFLLWVGATADDTLAKELQNLFSVTGDPKAFLATLKKGAGFAILLWTWVLPAIVKLNPGAPEK
jgi:hypothetical protein